MDHNMNLPSLWNDPTCMEDNKNNWEWNIQSFVGVFNSEEDSSMSLDLDALVESSALLEHTSTGYLEDAIADWTIRRKRRRLLPFNNTNQLNNHNNSRNEADLISNYTNYVDMDANIILAGNDGSPKSTVSMRSKPSVNWQGEAEMDIMLSKDVQLEKATAVAECFSRAKKKIAYPFDVVKPGGFKGDVTLDDINRRMLKRPTKPVRHPVGEFATNQTTFASGLGMSGKTVVALTKIQTPGRGTITIIRTKG
ncbi:hypothetical protein RJ641_021927 [Dillenia turbinata]|uniref:Protein XRI1 n=1 Tax=Dillenia turbinata TaxID=194707 RepID=A0AAN8UJK1_9MAGN